MANSVEVEVMRVVDRDQLLEALAAQGLEARPVEGDERLAIEVVQHGDADRFGEDLLVLLESWLAAQEMPLVPIQTDRSILLRPAAE